MYGRFFRNSMKPQINLGKFSPAELKSSRHEQAVKNVQSPCRIVSQSIARAYVVLRYREAS